MVDQDLTPYLLEANTGPVLKEDDDSDMQMVQVSVRTQSCCEGCFVSLFGRLQGLVELLFGTSETPLESSMQGSGVVHATACERLLSLGWINRWRCCVAGPRDECLGGAQHPVQHVDAARAAGSQAGRLAE